MATVLISGGTGLVGKALSKLLIEQGHEVRILTRNPKTENVIKYFFWDVDAEQIDEKAIDGVDHIVHLAGEGIAEKRWTKKRKRDIIDSRAKSIALISKTVIKKGMKLKSFVGASAIGIYGMITTDKIFKETDSAPEDFLSKTCTIWENSYNEIMAHASRSCILRISVVLSKNGGALKRLLPQFKLGLGSAVGSGKQYMPWIHIDDLAQIFMEALFNNNYEGVFNAATNEHTTNKDFSRKLAKALNKPFFMPNVPSFALKIVFGEMANVLLQGSRVSNGKLVEKGFQFRYPSLSEALAHLT